MQAPPEPEEFQEKLRKRGRIQKQRPKVHQIAKVEGAGLRNIWQKIIEKSNQIVRKEKERVK